VWTDWVLVLGWIECECEYVALFILGLDLMKWVLDWVMMDWVMRKVGLKIIISGWALTRFRNRVGFH
jgi:hypothetical protein